MSNGQTEVHIQLFRSESQMNLLSVDTTLIY